MNVQQFANRSIPSFVEKRYKIPEKLEESLQSQLHPKW